MPPLPDIWTQAQSQQQPRGTHTHSGQLKRPGPPLGEHSVIQHTPAPSLHRPMEDCPGPTKRKKSSGSEQVGNVFMASPMHFLSQLLFNKSPLFFCFLCQAPHSAMQPIPGKPVHLNQQPSSHYPSPKPGFWSPLHKGGAPWNLNERKSGQIDFQVSHR